MVSHPHPMNQTGIKFSPLLSPYVRMKSSPSPSPNPKFYPLELFQEGYSDPWDHLFQPKDTLLQKRSPVRLLFQVLPFLPWPTRLLASQRPPNWLSPTHYNSPCVKNSFRLSSLIYYHIIKTADALFTEDETSIGSDSVWLKDVCA